MSLPLVLLPGMNCSAGLWDDCGLRGRPDGTWTPELAETTLATQVQVLLDTLPPRFVLAGLSLGGIVAMAVARVAPERVGRLALLSTNAKAPSDQQVEGWAGARARLAQGTTARELQEELLEVLVTTEARARDEQLAGRVLAMADAVGAERLGAQLQLQGTRVDERPGLALLQVPCLVISGAHDALCPPTFHEEIAEAAATSELVTVDAGHLSSMERPERVGELLRSFASGVR